MITSADVKTAHQELSHPMTTESVFQPIAYPTKSSEMTWHVPNVNIALLDQSQILLVKISA